jgi:hypothetical protein
LPLKDQSLLDEYPYKLNEVDDRIRRNADTLDEIVFKGELSGLGPTLSPEDMSVDSDTPSLLDPSEREPGEVFVRCARSTSSFKEFIYICLNSNFYVGLILLGQRGILASVPWKQKKYAAHSDN